MQCPQLAKQPEGSGCNFNNNCKYPHCMENTYFTKNIPVEGRIEIGDYVDYPIEIYPLGDATPGIICNAQDIAICKELNGFKVKLFLCSRDIKVGDKFFSLLYSGKEFISEELPEDKYGGQPKGCYYTLTDGMIQWIPYNEAYKIIGEISPDGLGYVKEGKWYIADEVKIPTGEEPRYRGKPNPVKIKGPCGHFH